MTGLGVMINELFDERGGELLATKIGLRIVAADFADNRITLKFTDGTAIALFDDGQSCCEERYMCTDDDVHDLEGEILRAVQVKDGGYGESAYGEHEIQFLEIVTDREVVSFSCHNEHNGYYGGFYVRVKEVAKQ